MNKIKKFFKCLSEERDLNVKIDFTIYYNPLEIILWVIILSSVGVYISKLIMR